MIEKKLWRGLKTGVPAEGDILILGVPFDEAVSNARGAAEAPAHLRKLSALNPPVSEEGLDLRKLIIADQGDVNLDPEDSSYFGRVEKEAAALIATGKPSLFLGGDHSVTIPLGRAFAGHYSPKPVGMIHLDSHCDLMDSYDGHRWSHACPQRRFLEHENVVSKNLVMAGIRNFEVEEMEFLRENSAITVINARQFYSRNHKEIQSQIVEALKDVEAVYLSLDIDVLDPAYAPGTGVPEAGGLSTREVIELVREIMGNLPVKAVDLVEVAPVLDYRDITSWAAVKIIYEIFATLVTTKQ